MTLKWIPNASDTPRWNPHASARNPPNATGFGTDAANPSSISTAAQSSDSATGPAGRRSRAPASGDSFPIAWAFLARWPIVAWVPVSSQPVSYFRQPAVAIARPTTSASRASGAPRPPFAARGRAPAGRAAASSEYASPQRLNASASGTAASRIPWSIFPYAHRIDCATRIVRPSASEEPRVRHPAVTSPADSNIDRSISRSTNRGCGASQSAAKQTGGEKNRAGGVRSGLHVGASITSAASPNSTR